MNSRSTNLALWLFALGFFTSTWDTLLALELGGFTLKLYQGFFLCAFLFTAHSRRKEGIEALLAPLTAPFALCMLALAITQMGLAPWSAFPLKSFLYSCWLLFNLAAIWLTAQHLSRIAPSAFFLRTAWATLVFLSIVILVDQVAYQFGYTGGLIGQNQDAILKWGMSRPHAFSFEPSYLASFLSLGLITTAIPLFRLVKRKAFFLLSSLLVLFALVATTSRTGWFSLALGFIVIMLLPPLLGRKIQWRPLAAFLTLSAAVLTLFYITTPPQQREAMSRSLLNTLAQGNDGSANARVQAHILAFNMAKETHWIGTGIGASHRYFLKHGGEAFVFPDTYFPINNGNEVIMSTWGQVLAEGGILSLLLFGAAAFFLAKQLLLSWKSNDHILTLSSLSAALVFFGFISFGLGNLCRGDVWVWYALWSIVPAKANA